MRYMLVIVWPADRGTPTVYLNMNREMLDMRLNYEEIHIKSYGANYYIYAYNPFGNPYAISANKPLTDEWK